MKKLITLAALLVMVFAFSITAQAADSPSGKPQETTKAPENTETTAPTPTTPVAPETGGADMIFYIGSAAVAFAATATVAGKKLEA